MKMKELFNVEPISEIEEIIVECNTGEEIVLTKFRNILERYKNFFESVEAERCFNNIQVIINGATIDSNNALEFGKIISLGEGVSIYPCLNNTVTFICSYKIKV